MEGIERGWLRVRVYLDVGALVAHGAGYAQTRRDAVDEGPEAHALHDAVDAEPTPHTSITSAMPRRKSASVAGA